MKDKEMFIEDYLDEIRKLTLNIDIHALKNIVSEIVNTYYSGQKVLIVGNGGSAATASHLAVDLQKGISVDYSRPLRAISLTDNVPLITAIANDFSYSKIFSLQLEVIGSAGDILLLFSGSGKSLNIINACQTAKRMGIYTIGITGLDGKDVLASMADMSLVVQSQDMEKIEDLHMIISHIIFREVSNRVGDIGNTKHKV